MLDTVSIDFEFVRCILLKIRLSDGLIQAFSLEENHAEGLQFQ